MRSQSQQIIGKVRISAKVGLWDRSLESRSDALQFRNIIILHFEKNCLHLFGNCKEFFGIAKSYFYKEMPTLWVYKRVMISCIDLCFN